MIVLTNVISCSNGLRANWCPEYTVFNIKNYHQGMAENCGKLLIIFIIGVAMFSIGMALPSLEIVLSGGLLSGISGMIMLVGVAAKWK